MWIEMVPDNGRRYKFYDVKILIYKYHIDW